ncbi:unnamed protein product [Mytilus edulis]|uniref:Uncharacterized protein n=1 Tax=Mytilus edulis TaxID=6550 RepID=A0A8S3RIS8_MYTED|nr:unnamed protein product [Mytilus edulis]
MDNSKAMIASYKDEILQKIMFEKSEIKHEQELLETKVASMDLISNAISDNQFETSEIKDEQEFLETEDAGMDIIPNTISDNQLEKSEIKDEQEFLESEDDDMDFKSNLFSDDECKGFEILVEQELSKTKVFDMDIMPNGDILLSVQEYDNRISSPVFHILSQDGNVIGYSELYKTKMSSEINNLRFLRGLAIDKDRKLNLWEETDSYYSKNTKIHVLELL